MMLAGRIGMRVLSPDACPPFPVETVSDGRMPVGV